MTARNIQLIIYKIIESLTILTAVIITLFIFMFGKMQNYTSHEPNRT